MNERRRVGVSLDSAREIQPFGYFTHRIKEEKQRTDRTGIPFTLLLIDFKHSINGKGTWGFLNGKLEKEICHVLKDVTRCTDIKGWYETGCLGILLPNTTASGAQLLSERLQKRLENNLTIYLKVGDVIKDKILLTSSTYPDCVNVGLPSKKEKRGSNGDLKMKMTEYLDLKTYSKKNGNGSSKWKIGLFSLRSNQGSLAIDTIWIPVLNASSVKGYLVKAIKRLMDIAGALLAILLTSPIMLAAALAVKMTSKGPVLFKQERMGYMGKKFTFLKFRSMREDVDHSIHENYMTDFINGRLDSKSEDEVPLFKMADDPRITAVGRFLRKTSIDEFPQFFNVLRGDMSLVGPRPPIPYEVNKYKLWHQKRVIEVKPGITGLWQVGGRSSTTFEDMVRLDLQYVNNWSLKMDISIILKTIKAIITMKGAY